MEETLLFIQKPHDCHVLAGKCTPSKKNWRNCGTCVKGGKVVADGVLRRHPEIAEVEAITVSLNELKIREHKPQNQEAGQLLATLLNGVATYV
jgi:hypothetical protein